MNKPVGIDAQRATWLARQILPHEPALRASLRRLVRAQIDIDDVVQESYAVLAALDDVSQVRHPRAYLFSVARSIVLQQLRRSRVVSIEAVAEIDQLDIAHDDCSPERHAAAGQSLRRVGALLAGLPRRRREAFVLRKLEGLSQREIAQRMGISENTVEKHIGKCLRHLLQAFAEDGVATGDTPPRKAKDATTSGERHEQD